MVSVGVVGVGIGVRVSVGRDGVWVCVYVGGWRLCGGEQPYTISLFREIIYLQLPLQQ